jgi:hypothetical protein
MESIMTKASAPSALEALFGITDALLCNGIPLGGIGLSLAEAGRNGIPKASYAAALRNMVRPPHRDLGIIFSSSLNDCFPVLLGTTAYEEIIAEYGDDVEENADMNANGYDFWQILPIFNVPGTVDYWVERADLLHTLRTLRDNPSLFSRSVNRVLVPQYDVMPFCPPRALGGVTRKHIRSFAIDFPRFAIELEAAMVWPDPTVETVVCAKYANSIAASYLGFEVDLRVGSLISYADTQFAVELAAGTLSTEQEDGIRDRINSFLDALAPWVDAGPALDRFPELGAASWSCAIDAVLHIPDLWSSPATPYDEGIKLTKFIDQDHCIAWHHDLLATIRGYH